MNSKYLLAIDQGTTSSRAVLYDLTLQAIAQKSQEFPQYFPKPGWVEHDLEEIWNATRGTIEQVLKAASVAPKDLLGICITNQRETTCLWDRSGKPVSRAIVWQDRRTTERCEKWKRAGHEKTIQKKTGLLLDPYFSASKLHWLLNQEGGLKPRARAGEVLFGTIDSYLVYRLTGEHRTDPSNACRTLLYNLKKGTWDDDLLRFFQVPRQMLPEILSCNEVFGKTRNCSPLPDGIPIVSVLGDQQAALFGQACFQPGELKCTYGTGAFALLNIGNKPILSRQRLLTSVGWRIGGKETFVLEGSAFVAGAAIQWLRDQLGLISSSDASAELAAQVPDAGGVLFVPALTGLGAPHWIPQATGMFLGITRGTTRAHLCRAVLEGIGYEVHGLVAAMVQDAGGKKGTFKVDGGASRNPILMQFQADLLQREVVPSEWAETTARGTAMMGALGLGLYDLRGLAATWKGRPVFSPQIHSRLQKQWIRRWEKAIAALKLYSVGT